MAGKGRARTSAIGRPGEVDSQLTTGMRLWTSPPRGGGLGSAFTLIELMVVITLIGIACVMIVPEMKGSYQDALLRATCRQIVDTFQLAYSRAVSLNLNHRVRIDETSGRYVIEVSTGGLGSQPEYHPLKGVTGCEGKLDHRIRISIHRSSESLEDADLPPDARAEDRADNDGLVFHADGTATACEVLLRDQYGFGLRVAVSPVTGRARIGELPRE